MTSVKLTKVLAVILVASLQAFASVENQQFSEPSRKISFKSKDSNWLFISADEFDSKGSLFVARPKNKPKSLLSWRIDTPENPDKIPTAKKYAEKWLKDYPKFGFDLELAQDAKYGDLEGYEMELKNQTSSQKIHQFVVKNNNEIWLFTCSSSAQDFAQTWKGCQNILASAKLTK